MTFLDRVIRARLSAQSADRMRKSETALAPTLAIACVRSAPAGLGPHPGVVEAALPGRLQLLLPRRPPSLPLLQRRIPVHTPLSVAQRPVALQPCGGAAQSAGELTTFRTR